MKKIKLILAVLLGLGLISCGNSNVDSKKEKDEGSLTTWTVTLDLNYEGGGTYKTFEVQRELNGTNIKTQLENEIPTREEYKFDGWYHDAYCKVEWVYIRDRVLADTTLYASWTSTALPKTTINYVTDESFTYTGDLLTTVNQGSEVSFGIEVNEGYEGIPVVKANNNELTEVDGLYTFTAEESSYRITVSGLTKTVVIPDKDSIHIEFTLPSGWTPIAENPRLYYWGSETISDSIFSLGATTNMTSIDGATYYIDLDASITFDGMIIIFDQGSDVKKSLDITENLPTSAGNYIINVDWNAPWQEYAKDDWRFVASISAM